MTLEEKNKYAWLDAMSVKPGNKQQNQVNAKQLDKVLQFFDINSIRR